MQKFQSAAITSESIERIMLNTGISIAEMKKHLDGEVYLNNEYQVFVRRIKSSLPEYPDLVHLSIKRVDKMPVRDWRDFQEIKNQILGPEFEAVELYPAESRLVDSANQYHLWAIDDVRFRFPFGFGDRFIQDEALPGGAQRPHKKGETA